MLLLQSLDYRVLVFVVRQETEVKALLEIAVLPDLLLVVDLACLAQNVRQVDW